jgi:imidazolonepropionase-like amidohydrolase
MRTRYAALPFSAILAVSSIHALGAQPTVAPLRDIPSKTGAIAFVDVSVIPMDRERVLEHQTVIVADGRIGSIGAVASIMVPANARRIDGRGKFLMPGLVDMHAHFAPGSEELTEPAGRQLAMYLATGFTTVRGLGGAPTALGLRDRIKAGELIGPRLVVASPSINGNSAKSPADVVNKVEDAKRAGFDVIKTHGQFPSAEFYDTLIAATRRTGIPLSGHVTPEYGLERAMAAHQQIEHLDGYIAAVLADGSPSPDGGQFIVDPAILARVDRAKIKAIAEKTAKLGVWNGPTLALFETIGSDESPEALARWAEMRYVPAGAVQNYMKQKAGATNGMPAEGRKRFIEVRRELVKALHAAGAKLLVGSDSPQFFMTPGYAALREIDALVGAGLSPYAALEAATRNPAEYFGWSDVGTVATGKRADLLLLDANPVTSTANLQKVSGLMVDGRWLDAQRLSTLREAVASAAAAVK